MHSYSSPSLLYSDFLLDTQDSETYQNIILLASDKTKGLLISVLCYLQADATTPNIVGRQYWELLCLFVVAKSLTGFKRCATTRTACNRVCKWTQHVTSNDFGSCWPIKLHPFARGLKVTEPSSQLK